MPFSNGLSIDSSVSVPEAVFAADLDGDGDLDLLAADDGLDAVFWYENSDGAGSFGARQTISTLADGALSVTAADVDGDGDLDVLSAALDDSKVAWYENSDGEGNFGSQQIISTPLTAPRQVVAADVDGDGDLDVLSASSYDSRIAWYENSDGNGAFGSQQIISTAGPSPQSLFAADVDRDGDIDVLSATLGDDTIAWHENTDGVGAFAVRQVISTLADEPSTVLAADLDGDGDLDVLSTSAADHEISWYENTNGGGGFASQRVIAITEAVPFDLAVVDLDVDGDLDVVSGSSGGAGWYENLEADDGSGPCAEITPACLVPHEAISSEGGGLQLGWPVDLDGDGDLDIPVAYSDGEIAWYENETIHRSALFPQQTVISSLSNGARSVVAVDLDGDGDLDVLVASSGAGEVAWYEYSNLIGAFGSRQIISTLADGVQSAVAADLDGDGDFDVLSASRQDDKVAWYENTDGDGGFGDQQVISTLADDPFSVFGADIDGDGDVDVLSASRYDGKVAWYENTDGDGGFGSQRVISAVADGARSVSAADIDGDGDLDVLSASQFNDEVTWYENSDGQGGFAAPSVISTAGNGGMSVVAADLDSDGDLDVLAASRFDDKISWYENTDGAGGFGAQNVISTLTDGAQSVAAADLDNDGDLDVLSTARIGGEVAWYENLGGGAVFSPQRIITSLTATPFWVSTADLDDDGDLDVLTASSGDDTVAWYENKGGQFSLLTTDVAQLLVGNSEQHDLMKIVAVHRGRAGDSDVELASIELRFTDGAGTALTESGVGDLIQSLALHLDDGSNPDVLDSSDTLVASITDFSAITGGDGVLPWTLPDDDIHLQIAHGTPKTYFLTATLASDVESQTPGTFDLTHRTEDSSTGEDASEDIPLLLEFATNVGTGKVDTALSDDSCRAPLDLQLRDRTVSTTVTCEAGTVLGTGTGMEVVSPGALTLRAGRSIEMGGGLSVTTGTLTADIDPNLEP